MCVRKFFLIFFIQIIDIFGVTKMMATSKRDAVVCVEPALL